MLYVKACQLLRNSPRDLSPTSASAGTYQVIWSLIVTMRWPGVGDGPSNPYTQTTLVSIFNRRALAPWLLVAGAKVICPFTRNGSDASLWPGASCVAKPRNFLSAK